MASDVSICNEALLSLGSERISALSGSTKAARLCAQFYPTSRDELLESHNWTFTVKRVELAEVSGETPEFGYDYTYQLPADFLLDIRLEDTSVKYEIIGSHLNCDEDEVKLFYLASTTLTGSYFALFRAALVERLKSKLAIPLMGNGSKGLKAQETAFNQYLYWLGKAQEFDAMRGNETMDTTDDWLTAGGFDQSDYTYPEIDR
jgi:hypothetical protein